MQVAKWRNSLVVRLPAAVVEAVDLKPGDDIEIHVHGECVFKAVHIAEPYGSSICDALIASAALRAGCSTLLPEDMQDGRVIEGQRTVRNPFQSPFVAQGGL
jgi:predicted nucleic acid-binding protein